MFFVFCWVGSGGGGWGWGWSALGTPITEGLALKHPHHAQPDPSCQAWKLASGLPGWVGIPSIGRPGAPTEEVTHTPPAWADGTRKGPGRRAGRTGLTGFSVTSPLARRFLEAGGGASSWGAPDLPEAPPPRCHPTLGPLTRSRICADCCSPDMPPGGRGAVAHPQ